MRGPIRMNFYPLSHQLGIGVEVEVDLEEQVTVGRGSYICTIGSIGCSADTSGRTADAAHISTGHVRPRGGFVLYQGWQDFFCRYI